MQSICIKQKEQVLLVSRNSLIGPNFGGGGAKRMQLNFPLANVVLAIKEIMRDRSNANALNANSKPL